MDHGSYRLPISGLLALILSLIIVLLTKRNRSPEG